MRLNISTNCVWINNKHSIVWDSILLLTRVYISRDYIWFRGDTSYLAYIGAKNLVFWKIPEFVYFETKVNKACHSGCKPSIQILSKFRVLHIMHQSHDYLCKAIYIVHVTEAWYAKNEILTGFVKKVCKYYMPVIGQKFRFLASI